MSSWPDIAVQISASIGTPFVVERISSISGGCINQTYCIEGAVLTIDGSIKSRNHTGGTAPSQVRKAIKLARKGLS